MPVGDEGIPSAQASGHPPRRVACARDGLDGCQTEMGRKEQTALWRADSERPSLSAASAPARESNHGGMSTGPRTEEGKRR
jgi:hypothetical protein